MCLLAVAVALLAGSVQAWRLPGFNAGSKAAGAY